MKPPVCRVCAKRFSMKDEGLVRFANFTPLPELMVGHPRGLEWFCGEHLESAKALENLSSSEALGRLRSQFKEK